MTKTGVRAIRIQRQFSAVRFDDSLGNAKPEPGAWSYFFGCEKRLAAPGSPVGFSLAFATDDDERMRASLAGWGVVRWCELVSGHVRAGIEFMHLEDKSRESFARWLEEERPSSFIPKEQHGQSSGAWP
jgi:hypothetical protein